MANCLKSTMAVLMLLSLFSSSQAYVASNYTSWVNDIYSAFNIFRNTTLLGEYIMDQYTVRNWDFPYACWDDYDTLVERGLNGVK